MKCRGGCSVSEISSGSNESPSNEFERTYVVEQTDYSKEERDIAFALEVLNAAVINERQLASALSTWTLHGHTALADHLFQAGMVSEKIRIDLEECASTRLKEFESGMPRDHRQGLSADSLTKVALERLDESGRVAKLLGMSVAISGVKSDELREHLSRYQIIRKLGQGGLGTVWLARDLTMQRYVALKEIKNSKTVGKAALDRFRREAEITGRLEHPGIVPIYQLGEDSASGEAFYVMRFLGKQTLQDAIGEYHERREDGDDDPMLLRHLLVSFISVCQAVGHAHSRKVIHRDLKPENVAIDSFGQVIVIDWGLAKILDDGMLGDSLADIGFSDMADSQRTLAGQVLGSPLYMAPEQAAGRVDEIDESTDIFGLGAILYSILTGSAPHEQSRDLSGSTTTRQLITLIASGATPLARASNDDVDPVLETICAKAMAKRRYARYSSTTALAEDIQRWMAGEPVLAYKENFSQRMGRWVQHHQRLTQLLVAVLIITIVVGTTLAIATRQNSIAASQARFEEMRSDEREVEVQLLAAGQDLSVDVRFMSTLPPIQGIIDARAGTDGSESEEVWIGRLETIYEGLLRANPNYLVIAYITVGEDTPQEIVRVERQTTDQGYIRRMPQSRLASLTMSTFFKDALEMAPGEVKISLTERISGKHANTGLRRMIAAIPVFDEQSGETFGLVAIETHVTSQIQNILSGLDGRLGEIYITDAAGKVLVTSNPKFGVEVVTQEMNISDHISDTAHFFSEGSRQRYLSDESSFIVRRVQLDVTDTACSLGIVQKLSSSD